MTTYATNDEWAVQQNYASFSAYSSKNNFPSANRLTAAREEAYAHINRYVDGSAASTWSDTLKFIELRTVTTILMIERGNISQDQLQTIPPDFISESDRNLLMNLGSDSTNVGWTT